MGKKKEAAARAALEAREAEIAAELKRREKKLAKKKSKKKTLAAIVIEARAEVDGGLDPADADVVVPVTEEKPRHPHLVHLDRVGELSKIIDNPATKKKARKAAEAELAELRAEGERLNAAKAVDDEELKRKVAEKRAAREALSPSNLPDPATIDRDDADAVREYNERAVKAGATLLTSTEERAKVKARKEPRGPLGDNKADAAIVKKVEAAVDAVAQAVEAIETDRGRIFEAGTAQEEELANPSDAQPMLEEGRNGYKIIQLDAAGKPDPRKVRQLTRVTTFVGNIDDESILKQWSIRKVIEGLALDTLEIGRERDALITDVGEIIHRRDVTIAKAIKADRKGKLGIGEVGRITAAAEKEAKDALNKIADEAALLAGRHEKANFGTHLHTLSEIRDADGIDAVRKLHESGELVAHANDSINEGLEPMPVTSTDLASIEAYDERMNRLGAKVLHPEAVVVNDDMGYAGRIDRIIVAKLPEIVFNAGKPTEWRRPADTRARRYIADTKTGRVDLGAGKISRQLAAYALGDLYDIETGERTPHRAARDVALVFHLPQGEGVCAVRAVDLKAGAALLKLSAEVRRARNTGRYTIDTTVDIADPAPDVAEGGEAVE